MRDVIWTLIIVWVVYQLYKIIRSSRVYVYQKHDHHYNDQNTGETKVQESQKESGRKLNSDKGGEYVDYEEIK